MPVNFDLSAYVNPVQVLPNIDITGAYRQWQEHHLNEKRLDEQKRQFNESEERNKYQFGQTQAHAERVSDDINSRFALTQGENTNQKGYAQQSEKFKQQQSLLAKARAAVAENRWNEVESYMGTLRALGASVDRTLDQEGRPSYRLQEGEPPSVTGETFQSSIAKINQNRTGSNPFDTSLGTVSQSVQQSAGPPTTLEGSEGPSVQPQPMIPGTNTPDETLNAPLNTEPPTTSEGSGSQAYDPYAIDSRTIGTMNALRMDPLLAGIEGAFPNRFQPQIRSLTEGMRALGASPEGTLDMMQKPMDTAARLMSSEMAAEGQMARAGITQTGKQDSQERLLKKDGENAAKEVSKNYGVSSAVSNTIEMQQIHEQLMSDDPNANADGVKALLSMREGNRLTDKDFNIGVTGIASNFQQLKQAVERVYINGLTPDQKSNFNQLIQMFNDGNKRRIQAGSKKMLNYLKKLDTDAERRGAYRYIIGLIPEDYLPEEVRSWEPTQTFGGKSSVPNRSNRTSVSVTAPTTNEATSGVRELTDEETDAEINSLEKELDLYQ